LEVEVKKAQQPLTQLQKLGQLRAGELSASNSKFSPGVKAPKRRVNTQISEAAAKAVKADI
jgi:hypothetical protein